jgi:hypothetical protein
MTAVKKVTVRSVHISKQYGDDDRYTCAVSLQAPTGTIELKIPEDRVNQIVELVAGLIVQGTTEAMKQMTSDAMQHVAIAHQSEDESEPEESA